MRFTPFLFLPSKPKSIFDVFFLSNISESIKSFNCKFRDKLFRDSL